MARVYFKEDRLVIEPFFRLMFTHRISVKYTDIERIECPPGSDILFYLKNGKVKKVWDLSVTMYTEFGEMLKKYKIPYRVTMEDAGHETIDTVREKAAKCREVAIAYANRSLKEKLGPEYEIEAKLVERIVGTTLEFRLLKNGVVQEEADYTKGIDDNPLIDEMDIAILSSWDPVYDRAEYYIDEEALTDADCEEYVKDNPLDIIFDHYGKDAE